MEDQRTYLCPFCHADLNPREYIVLRGEAARSACACAAQPCSGRL